MKEKLAALWAQAQEKVQPHWIELKAQGLTGLRQKIREQAPALWEAAQEKAKVAWAWLTVRVKAVPVSKQALVHVAVGMAVVALWFVFKALPGVIAYALSMTMVVAFIALIVAFMAYGGVAIVIPLLQPAVAEAAE